MECNISEEQLWSWVDTGASQLATHLAACPRCRKLASEIRAGMRVATVGAKSLGTPLPEKIGSYTIKGLLGEGGQGLVYKAEQKSPQRLVALKLLKGGGSVSLHDVRHFQRETQTLAALNHPGIATIYEAGRTEEGQHYFAMELVTGQPLDVYVRDRAVPREGRLNLFRKICEAVQYAHGHGVVHRDLKPTNILVVEESTEEVADGSATQYGDARTNGNGDGSGQPKVLDFGLARITDAELTFTAVSTDTGPIMGTLRYMSPEQACGHVRAIGPRTDVYALGVILYELLTDRAPYDIGPFMPEAVRTICEQLPQKPSSVCRSLRGDLETIVLKALEKDPSRRYQTVQELDADVGRFLADEPILAQRPTRFYILRKKLARHPLRFVLAALAIVVAVGGLYAAALWKQRELFVARAQALESLWVLETADPESVGWGSMRAEALFARCPDVPEVLLAYVRARFEASQERGDDFLLDDVHVLRGRITRNPSKWALDLLLAEIYEKRGRTDDARRASFEAAQAAPDTADGWYIRSLATLDLDRARQCAERAVKLDRAHTWAKWRLSNLYLHFEDYAGALRVAGELQGFGYDPSAWLRFKGRALARQGRYPEALEVYRQVVAGAPSDPSAHLSVAHVNFCQRRHDDAIENYTTAIELCNLPVEAKWIHYRRANPYWMTGRLDKAAEDYHGFLKLAPPASRAHARLYLVLHDRARQLEREGLFSDADRRREEANEVLTAARDGAAAEGWLGLIYRCLLDNRATEELVKAAENREQLCEAYYYAAESCLLKGEIKDARRYFEKCVETNVVFDPSTTTLDPMSEWHLARWRLSQLDGQAPTTGELSDK